AIRAQVGGVVAAVVPYYLPGVRHPLGRAVAGYLRHKDWPQAAAIDALQEIADATGSDDAAARARVVWAYSAENPDGASTLHDRWPVLLAALDAATRAPMVAELCARRDARALATVPADDALEIPEFTPGRGNAPAPTHANVLALLEVVGDRVRLESFTGRIVVAGMPPEAGHFPDGEWADACTTEFTALCERRGLNVGRQTVAASVVAHARRREYNALTELAQRLAAGWDGTPRVDGSMARYWGAAPGAAAAAVARVFMLSLAARALRPGVKVDTCPVLIGPQGTFKSQALRALVGDALFSDSPLPIGTGDKDAMQVLRGTWLWELAEGVGLTRQDRNAVKAFLSSQADKFRASYGQFPELVPRQTCFVASTNEVEMLNDPTGARRFLPVQVGVTHPIDVAGVTADRAQLLGEAAHRVLAGEPHWPSPAEEAALGGAREAATEADPWEGPIAAWAHHNGTPDGATVSHIAECALGIAPGRLGKPEQARIAAALRGLGWTKRQAGRDRVRTWFPPVA
ncbi:MAG TPA: VapE family protein, partial [Polyangiaceae bacterium]|nr:VapE family protein [Polyangiaceae bacterium]